MTLQMVMSWKRTKRSSPSKSSSKIMIKAKIKKRSKRTWPRSKSRSNHQIRCKCNLISNLVNRFVVKAKLRSTSPTKLLLRYLLPAELVVDLQQNPPKLRRRSLTSKTILVKESSKIRIPTRRRRCRKSRTKIEKRSTTKKRAMAEAKEEITAD